ncbi:MAG: GNAT family protein [Actinomycetota bacterium]|nr:GNAT family protein [Actinomycetota bacterium]
MITTARIHLRPVLPADYLRLYEIENDPATALTWRYRGEMPSLAGYEPALWKQTQQIMVVEGRDTGVVVGYLQLHDLDLRAGHGWFSLYAGPEHRGSGLVMEGLMAFTEWAFGEWPIRWLYAHSFEHNVHSFESGLRRGPAQRLGVLRERMLVDGALTDVHVIGIDRDAWIPSPLRRRFNLLRNRRI